MQHALTDSQQVGVEKLHKFLQSGERVFVLIGPAGSGKTTMLKYALHDILKDESAGKKSSMQIAGITLAHQAKKVLRNSIPNSYTFAGAYGYKEQVLKSGQRVFKPVDKKFLKEEPVGYFPLKVFVHDECSMYTYEMMKLTLENTSMFSKIIFVGDKCQLPPIDERMRPDEDSPVFNLQLPDFCKHELTERVRQKEGNPILDLADALREEIQGSHNINRIVSMILEPRICNDSGYMIIKRNDAIERYIQSKDYLNDKIIAFRNSTTSKVNEDIRNILFPDVNEYVVKNDLLFMTNNYMVPNMPYPVKVENSEQFYVSAVHTENLNVSYHGKINCLVIHPKKMKEKLLYYPSLQGTKKYLEVKNELHQNALNDGKQWKAYYNFTDTFAEFTYGYGVNAYKSQGSTYRNVYIDLIDILTVGPLTPKRKLQSLYTSVTRATDYSFFIQ